MTKRTHSSYRKLITLQGAIYVAFLAAVVILTVMYPNPDTYCADPTNSDISLSTPGA